MGRAPCCEKVGLKKGRWTSEEDKILINYIAEHGEGSWKSMPKNAGLLRCGKSCRLRWVNYLKADLKRGDFTQEDEDTIIKLHASFGNRWSLIAGHLPGRTDNEIKNYWNTHLKRKLDTLDHSNNNNHSPMPTGTNKRKKDRRLGKNEQHTSSIESMTSDEKSDQSDQQGPGKLRTDSVSVKEEGARGCIDGIKLEDFDNELWESVKEICPWDWSNVDQLAGLQG